MLHQARVGLVRVIPDLVQADQLIGKAVRRLALRYVQRVLALLEADRVVDVRPVRRQLVMVVEVQVAAHRVDRRECRVRVALGDRRVVGRVAGQVVVRRAAVAGRVVLAELLSDYHQVVVVLEDVARDVVGVVVHVLRRVGAHLRPVGVVQAPVVQARNKTYKQKQHISKSVLGYRLIDGRSSAGGAPT